MRFGIKIWSTNSELMKKAPGYHDRGDFDYIELSAIIGSFDKKKASLLSDIPVIIHCDNDGVDFSRKDLYEGNISAFTTAQQFADFFNSEYIIVHPGYQGDINTAGLLIRELDDKRICVENMPGKIVSLASECVGRTPEELKGLGAKSFCLDFSHAIKASVTLKKEPFWFIERLKSLQPAIYHVSDGISSSEVDEHLNIGEGDFDFERIGRFIDRDGLVTLETPKANLNSLDNDIKNIKRFKDKIANPL